MRVYELIKQLNKMPQDDEVWLSDTYESKCYLVGRVYRDLVSDLDPVKKVIIENVERN